MKKSELRKMIKEELELIEKAPQFKEDRDAEEIGDIILKLNQVGRSLKFDNKLTSNVKRDLDKSIKSLQSLRGSIRVGR